MSFAAGGGKGNVRSDINITPLVDVVLVLLIIFMVAVPQLLKQFEVKVPEKADVDVATPQTTSQAVLKITGDGKLLLNNEPVAREALGDKVRDVFAPRREKLLFFDIEDQANYGQVVEVMDTCRGSGVTTFGLMTR